MPPYALSALALLASTAVVSGPAYGQQGYSIPKGQLITALEAFSRQSDLQIIYDSDQVRSAISPGVQGAMSADRALNAILRGTGFSAERDPSGAIAIVKIQKISYASSESGIISASPTDARSDEDNSQVRASVEDIVVTAQRREQRLQDVPIAVSALTSDQVQSQGITSTHDIAQAVTGMTITESGGYVQPFIRGIGSTVTNLGEQGSAATYVDGVYMPAVHGQIYELANIESIQVLKGPQGTLFGRNANSGAIVITTRQPQFQPEGSLAVSYGNYDAVKVSGYATGPLNEQMAVSLAGTFDRRDGWVKNLFDGSTDGKAKRYTLRGSALVEFSEDLRLTVTGDVLRAEDPTAILNQPINGYLGYVSGGLIPQGPRDYVGNEKTNFIVKQRGVSGKLSWDVGDVTLLSTTAYRYYSSESIFFDIDTTPARLSVINQKDAGTNFTQEFQMNYDRPGSFNMVLGGFYMRQKANYKPLRIDTPAGTTLITAQQVTEAFAGFIDGTYILGDFELTGGLRYSYERKAYDAQLQGAPVVNNAHKSWDAFTPRVVLAYHPSKSLLTYASFSQGFKSGTFNANGLSTIAVDPETVDAYEVGLKLSPQPGLTLNLSAFKYLTKDLQIQALDPATLLINIRNAASVKSKGIDLEAAWRPVNDLSLSLGVSYLHSKFDKFTNALIFVPAAIGDGRNASLIADVSGNNNVRSPAWTFNFAGQYELHLANGGSIVPSFNVYHSSKFYWEAGNRLIQPSFTVINASLTWNLPGDRVSLGIWGRNITDEVRYRNISAAATSDRGAADEPALYGVRLEYRF